MIIIIYMRISRTIWTKLKPLTHFYTSDSQRPDVYATIIETALHGQDDFWSYPIGRSDKTIGGTFKTDRTKVADFHAAIFSEENIRSLNIPVNKFLGMNVHKTVENFTNNAGNFAFF